MHRQLIGCADVVHIIPQDERRRTRGDAHADFGEIGFAACFWLIEIDHRRPAALPRFALAFPIGLVGEEIIVMRFELLTGIVALALQGFAVAVIYPHQPANPALNPRNKRMVWIKVAAETGSVSVNLRACIKR